MAAAIEFPKCFTISVRIPAIGVGSWHGVYSAPFDTDRSSRWPQRKGRARAKGSTPSMEGRKDRGRPETTLTQQYLNNFFPL